MGGSKRHVFDGSCPSCLRDWSNTGFHPILDWRLAADTLDLLRDGSIARDRWAGLRAAALKGVSQSFGWQVVDAGPMPVIDTGQGLICIVHQLQNIDGQIDTGIATLHGPALPFDVLNLDRRPGEIYRRLSSSHCRNTRRRQAGCAVVAQRRPPASQRAAGRMWVCVRSAGLNLLINLQFSAIHRALWEPRRGDAQRNQARP
jgi:hypothetical protein